MSVVLFIWYAVFAVQLFLGYGTAYRLTKNGGDNGFALWGWLLVTNLAALVPGLGFYLWSRNKDTDVHYTPSHTQTALSAVKPLNSNEGGWICKECGSKNAINRTYCGVCGKYK